MASHFHPPATATFTFKHASNVDIKADVFLPDDSTKSELPVLLWFHGGGLLMSSRLGIGPHLRRAANKHNICVVSADYRLAPQAPLPDILEDVRDAARWVREELPSKFETGRINPATLVVSGGSAGGYLALLAAHPTIGISPPPKAVIAIYPITNPLGPFFTTPQRPVVDIINDRIITREEMAPHLALDAPVLSGYGPVPYPPPAGDRGEVYLYMVQEACLKDLLFANAPHATVTDFIPAEFWNKDSPPLFLFHGEVDNRVGIEQTYSLIEALKAAGATYEFEHVAAPGAQHLFDQLDPSEEMEGMYAFLLKHL